MNDVISTTTTRTAVGVGGRADPHGGGLPLQGVSAKGRLDGLLFELLVEQRWRNESDRVIEAVFTFPVPVRAVLLGLELELGERRLEAVAIAKRAATERYEEAIDAGDAAVLLESVGNGLYTVSVGNLKPGETAVIRYRHAELLDANRGLLRLQVPTVIAPRYGNAADAGLEGPAVPGTDLIAEYSFDLEILLAGLKDPASLSSPTHPIRSEAREEGVVVRLAKSATLDRDVVLEVPQALVPSAALVAPDGESEWVVVASAVLPGLSATEHRALALTVVLDCSGSMAGDSIEAAKRAVGRVLGNLDAADRIALLRFGSTCCWETEGLVPAAREQLARLRGRVQKVEADLGGTEMRQALEAAMRQPAPKGIPADLLMITDGQVHELNALAGLVAKAHRRLFVVAVGSAPNEALARRLSETTGGACEFVASGELAEDAILRMFRRMRAQPRRVVRVDWPGELAWQIPAPAAVFPDETVHVVAALKSPPSGQVQVHVGAAALDGAGAAVIAMPVESAPLPSSVASALLRVAGARRVRMLAEDGAVEAATALAERLQIASAFTSFVVVAERSAEEKAKGLPATMALPHMLPAGFGGAARAAPVALACMDVGEPAIHSMREFSQPPTSERLRCSWTTHYRGPSGASTKREGAVSSIDHRMARELLEKLRQGSKPTTLRDLEAAGLDPDLCATLAVIGEEAGVSEVDLVDAFLEMLLRNAEATRGEFNAVRSGWSLRRKLFAGRGTRRLRATLRERVFEFPLEMPSGPWFRG